MIIRKPGVLETWGLKLVQTCTEHSSHCRNRSMIKGGYCVSVIRNVIICCTHGCYKWPVYSLIAAGWQSLYGDIHSFDCNLTKSYHCYKQCYICQVNRHTRSDTTGMLGLFVCLFLTSKCSNSLSLYSIILLR